MTLPEMENALLVLDERLRGILAEDGARALTQALSDLRRDKPRWEGERGRRRKKTMDWRWWWTLAITRGTPLRFIETEVGGDIKVRMIVDVYCELSELKNGRPLGKHNIVLRVWTADESVWFREGIDAPEVLCGVADGMGRRVMMRCHFDFEKDPHAGPRHHLQVGGIPLADEHSWFHESLGQPRFAHHPMGLVMVCEFVVRNFFPDRFEAVCGEGTWRSALAAEQATYLPQFYRDQGVHPPAGALEESLLGRLWNH